MALSRFWDITFKLDGDYKSYDELVQAALNDDAYQKFFPGIASEVLLEQLKKFVQDPKNRPEKDGIINGILYKKENGRQIDSTRRYYLVKEENLNEFNLYVKITKGRNLGFYRVYNHEQEVKQLIQFGLNELKYTGQLPIVADYKSFALDNKFYVSRERCEFISRLLNATVIATQNCLKIDYDVTKLGARKQIHKRRLATVAATTTITPTTSYSCPDDHSIDDQDSANIDAQQSLSIVPTTTAKTLSTTTKTISHGHGNKKRQNTGRLPVTTRSISGQSRLQIRTKENSIADSPSSSLPQPVIATKPVQPKPVTRKRGRVLEHEENDENSVDKPVMLDTAASTNGKAMKAKTRGTTNKRTKK